MEGTTLTCRKCKGALKTDALFCPTCGKKVREQRVKTGWLRGARARAEQLARATCRARKIGYNGFHALAAGGRTAACNDAYEYAFKIHDYDVRVYEYHMPAHYSERLVLVASFNKATPGKDEFQTYDVPAFVRLMLYSDLGNVFLPREDV